MRDGSRESWEQSKMLGAQRCTRTQILEDLGRDFRFAVRKHRDLKKINQGHPRGQSGDRRQHVEEQIYPRGCSHTVFLLRADLPLSMNCRVQVAQTAGLSGCTRCGDLDFQTNLCLKERHRHEAWGGGEVRGEGSGSTALGLRQVTRNCFFIA